jgi:vacuolar protein sorting-associated protein 18
MKNRAYSTISNLQRCELCYDLLQRDQFYLFPCAHGFHSACLVDHAQHSLATSQQQILKGLLESMQTLLVRAKDSDSRARTALESVQAEIDGLVAADCPLCGYAMIDSITRPLIPVEETKDANSWKL